jgi:(p)ppGpp synthase/HD superfamily hydrolase
VVCLFGFRISAFGLRVSDFLQALRLVVYAWLWGKLGKICYLLLMSDEELLEKAIGIAVSAHRAQKDRYQAPYILHPLRVMARLDNTTEKIVGILHDVVEDTDWTFEGLKREGFPPAVLLALDCVTKREGEEYEDFVKRSASNSIAIRVKLADLEDNMDLRRMPQVSDQDLHRLQKYVKAWRFLKAVS